MVARVADEIPHDQEVIDIAHLLDNAKLVIESFLQLRGFFRRIAQRKPIEAELIEIFPRRVTLRHIKVRQLCDAELDLHVAAIGNLLRIFQRLQRIRKKLRHLLRRFHIILSALVAHTILVLQLLAGLDAEQNVVRLGVRRQRVMHVVRRHQLNAGLRAHAQKLLVDDLLVGDPMILQFQEEIALAENLLVLQRDLFALVVHAAHQITRYFPRKAGAQRNDALVVLLQNFLIDTRFVIVTLHKARRDDLDQIGIADVVFRQQHQMIVSVLTAGILTVKPGIWRIVHLAPEDWLDTLRARRPVKVDHAVHCAVVGDRRAVHAKLLHPRHIFFYFIRTVQEAVLRMDM